MNANPTRTRLIAILLIIGSMSSLTVGASMAKSLFSVMGPAGTTVVRLAIAALILIGVRRPWKNQMNAKQWRWIVYYGAGLGLMNLFFYLSIERLPIGLAIGIEFLGPLTLALCLSRTARDLVWAFLALIGIGLILPHTNASEIDLLGVFYALIAAGFWAYYILISKKIGEFEPGANSTGYGMIVGSLMALPFGATGAAQLSEHLHLIPIALCVGLFSSAIPYSLEMKALRNLDAKTFGIVLSLEPAIGAMAAFLILNEAMTSLQLIAVAFIVTASIGSTLFSRPVKSIG